MGRPRKSDATNTEELTGSEIQNELETPEANEQEQTPEAPEANAAKEAEEIIPARVLELMRLYPHYEELWVTPRGFVHPVGTPQYLIKDATLYKNKFYNK